MKKNILIIAAAFVMASCGGKGNNPTPPTPPAPTKAVLTLPLNNALCATGTVVSDSISTITFTWKTAANTDHYDLYLQNLLDKSSKTYSATDNQLALNIKRGTPFSWYVISRSSSSTVTAQSDTWKFYNAGKGEISYPPYPATLTSPTFSQAVTATSGKVNLTWQGKSVLAGTIENYDVYFGTAQSPPLLKDKITDSFLNNVSVTSGQTYYWKVVTHDFIGNSSNSAVYQFSVK
ncbi:hypothetical protein [Mucilaginibacter celer]|uniref:Fibronectin type-III domain-containing protein n=1 Tax=Mucilaginibacter celer TaxID=2305508 RepID=A0A494W2Y0_9SPHI|nr:hypothetical protein [Mucilaginibacter celer]AYL98103.1 hypothetical protein HYN43_023690 [Mucilaginibacter celer]